MPPGVAPYCAVSDRVRSSSPSILFAAYKGNHLFSTRWRQRTSHQPRKPISHSHNFLCQFIVKRPDYPWTPPPYGTQVPSCSVRVHKQYHRCPTARRPPDLQFSVRLSSCATKNHPPPLLNSCSRSSRNSLLTHLVRSAVKTTDSHILFRLKLEAPTYLFQSDLLPVTMSLFSLTLIFLINSEADSLYSSFLYTHSKTYYLSKSRSRKAIFQFSTY